MINVPSFTVVRGVMFRCGGLLDAEKRILSSSHWGAGTRENSADVVMHLTERETIALCRHVMRRFRAEERSQREQYAKRDNISIRFGADGVATTTD